MATSLAASELGRCAVKQLVWQVGMQTMFLWTEVSMGEIECWPWSLENTAHRSLLCPGLCSHRPVRMPVPDALIVRLISASDDYKSLKTNIFTQGLLGWEQSTCMFQILNVFMFVLICSCIIKWSLWQMTNRQLYELNKYDWQVWHQRPLLWPCPCILLHVLLPAHADKSGVYETWVWVSSSCLNMAM